MPDTRRAMVTLGLAAAGVALAGCWVTQGSGPADGTGTSAAATSASTTATTPKISPPPQDPDDVAMDTAAPTAAALQITYAGADDAAGGVAVGAYVAGVLEQGGRCVLTLSKGGESATAESEARPDVTNTSCGQMIVPFSALTPGIWSAEVTYVSAAGQVVAAGRTDVVVT